ncbi:hypothetical protein GCM10009557_46700 [Virgisporangium ochraceum]|uniref:Uncharacterized protein n=1 Tax=Virgisporangium ochraceum TaxID=65505 RepID=A0A8J4A498_9ACTN|nr:hypothetical protein [Virgisporangium ochraceum]GIJ75542.1 hypothetical protein Voc01_104590 [Virgisporangium ochraceum]
MDRLLVAVDSAVGVRAEDLAAVWRDDPEAAAVGPASVGDGGSGGRVFVPGLVELVVVPLAVNLASTALYELVRRLVVRSSAQQASQPAPQPVLDLELVESTTPDGDRVLVVRTRSVGS